MPKKPVVVLGSILLVVVVATGVAVGLMFFNAKPAAPATSTHTTQASQNGPDLSLNFGACSAVTNAVIQKDLQPEVDTSKLSGPVNEGWAYQINNDKTQLCRYPLAAASDTTNSFNVYVTQYASSDTQASDLSGEQNAQGAIAVSGIPDAYFRVISDSSQTRYALFAFSTKSLYEFDLVQPASAASLASSDVQTVLANIAGTANIQSL